MVIGRTARFVKKEQALDYVYGYTIINDVSARDFQFHTTQWSAGKVGDTLAPVGPYIADRTEIPDPHVLDLKTWVNGRSCRTAPRRNFIFDIGYIIEYLTNIMTLSPGRPHRDRHPGRAWASRASRRSRCSRATA